MISRHTGSNVGFFEKMSFVFESEIVSVIQQNPQGLTISGITLLPSTVFKTLYFTPRTASFSENSKTGRNGKKYDRELKLNIPKNRVEVDEQIQLINTCKIAIIYKDRNGNQKLLRNMRLQDGFQLNSNNRYDIKFTGSGKSYSKFLIDTIDDSIEVLPDGLLTDSSGDYITDSSGDYITD